MAPRNSSGLIGGTIPRNERVHVSVPARAGAGGGMVSLSTLYQQEMEPRDPVTKGAYTAYQTSSSTGKSEATGGRAMYVPPVDRVTLDVFMVGGGGAGGRDRGGGGGGGGVLRFHLDILLGSVYTITIGAGATDYQQETGGSTTIDGPYCNLITAVGGGVGGGAGGTPPNSGGSGGYGGNGGGHGENGSNQNESYGIWGQGNSGSFQTSTGNTDGNYGSGGGGYNRQLPKTASGTNSFWSGSVGGEGITHPWYWNSSPPLNLAWTRKGGTWSETGKDRIMATSNTSYWQSGANAGPMFGAGANQYDTTDTYSSGAGHNSGNSDRDGKANLGGGGAGGNGSGGAQGQGGSGYVTIAAPQSLVSPYEVYGAGHSATKFVTTVTGSGNTRIARGTHMKTDSNQITDSGIVDLSLMSMSPYDYYGFGSSGTIKVTMA